MNPTKTTFKSRWLLILIVLIIGVWVIRIMITSLANSQRQKGVPIIQWELTFGNDAEVTDIQTTEDGNYIVIGITEPKGQWGRDIWIRKLNTQGHIMWEQIFDRKQFDIPSTIRPTPDGGYVVAGDSSLVNNKEFIAWVWKLDAHGKLIWERFFDHSIQAIHPMRDRGYIAVGSGWIFKLDIQGEMLWKHRFTEEKKPDIAEAFSPTPDGNYIIGGHRYYADGWIQKVDTQGQEIWERTFGGEKADLLYDLHPTQDGGYIVAGSTHSKTNGWWNGYADAWVMKLNPQGQILWERTFEERVMVIAKSITLTSDNRYFVVGTDEGGRVGAAWVMKLDSQGHLMWKRTFNDTLFQLSRYAAYAVQSMPDGGCLVGGEKGRKAWVFKLSMKDSQ